MHSSLSSYPAAVAAILLYCSSVLGLADQENSALHGGRGGSGGHGGFGGHHGGFGGHHGGFGMHRGGYGGYGGYGMYPGFLAPPPPPMAFGMPPPPLPYPPPMPVGIGAAPFGAGAPVMQVATLGVSAPAMMSSGYVGASPVVGTGFAAAPSLGNQFASYQEGSGLGAGGFGGGVSAQANAQVSLNGMQQPASFASPPFGLAVQGPSAGMVSSGRFAAAGGQAAQSGRMLNQSTDGLQIEVDGSASQPMPPQQPLPPQMPSPPPPAMAPPQPMPVTTGSTLVSKGFVRKSESFQEQKSGSRNSNKEFEKVTTQA